MKLLITGGLGFLGSNLARHALDLGHDLTIFDNLSRRGSAENLAWLREHGKFQFTHGDIRNFNDVSRICNSIIPEAVFHLAGQVAMTTSIENPILDFEINILGTVNLLECMRKANPEAIIVYSSTNKVYGDLEQFGYLEEEKRYLCIERPAGFDESTPLDFHSPYGCSKGAADQYMLDFHRMYGMKTIVFRHSSMYGGRQFSSFDQGWIGWFCHQAIQAASHSQHRFTISGNGKQVRDVLHAEDVTRLYLAAVEHNQVAQGEAFNIGGGMENSLSLLELFDILQEKTGAQLNFERLPPRSSDQRVFVANISKATALLHWRPNVGLRTGIEEMLDWTRTQSCEVIG